MTGKMQYDGGIDARESGHMETWLSGRKRLTANEVRGNSLRGFESHRLRRIEYEEQFSKLIKCSAAK